MVAKSCVALCRAAALIALCLSGWATVAAAEEKALPSITISTPGLSGAAAVSALGRNLPAVAAHYGMTAAELRQLLLRDSGWRLTATGSLVRLSPLPPATARMAAAAASPLAASPAPAYPLADTFKLHSQPDAQKTIYLNFTGQTLTQHANPVIGALDEVIVPPFSLDADPAFSDAERTAIQEIFQRVAEDYAPFDVDVTTEVPPAARLRREELGDSIYGIDVLFALKDGSWSTPLGNPFQASAGTSMLRAFFSTYSVTDAANNESTAKPAVVFYTAQNPKIATLADAASREIGTTLGLFDVKLGCHSDPFTGQGNSAVNGWVPMMAELSDKPLRQFSKGEYNNPGPCISGEPQIQDQIAVIRSAGVLNAKNQPDLNAGLTLRDDDVGNTTAAATWLPVASTSGRSEATFKGIITDATDTDMFWLKAGTGLLDISATPAPFGPNLDVKLTLRDSAGKLVAESNPLGLLNARITQQIAAPGRYYIEVKGTGEGDPKVTGYSSYGSIGAYGLAGSFVTPANSPPSASFTAQKGTIPLSVNLDPSASADDGAIINYLWDFGDGTTRRTTSSAPEQKIYSKAGDYTVKLTVLDDTGLTSTISKTVSVSQGIGMPTAAFSVSRDSGPAPLAVTFDPSASSDNGSIVSYSWDFGDGTTRTDATLANPAKTYAQPGTYTVKLTVKDNDNNSNSATRTITVTQPTRPTAAFAPTITRGYAPLTVSFDPWESTDDGRIVTFDWDFGDGTKTSKTSSAAVSQTFTKAGTYTVSLKVTDDTGLFSTVTKDITVLAAAAPVAAFTASQSSVFTGTAVTFDPATSRDDVQIASYRWDFGDGDIRTQTSPAVVSKTYATPGTYTVRLRVTNNAGLTHEATRSIEVKAPVAPVASFTASQSSVFTGTAVTFDPAASRDDVQIASYRWDFGDGDIRTQASAAVISKTYATPGTYTVRLRVTDNAGLTHEASRSIEVMKPISGAPVAQFSVTPEQGFAPLFVSFDPSASRDDVGILRYDWDFGSGEPRSDQAPAVFTRAFTEPGSHIVTLTVTDEDGLTHTTSRTITVTQPEPPVASFTASVTQGIAPLKVTFDPAASRGDRPIASFGWNFGTGEPRTETTPAAMAVTYDKPGSYVARLTVTDDAGASTVAERTITVLAPPPPAVDGPRVAGVTLQLARASKGRVKARATVTVLDPGGKPAPSVTVTARWEDPVPATSSARTRANGVVALTSPATAATGCLRITITGLRVGKKLYPVEPPVQGEVCRS